MEQSGLCQMVRDSKECVPCVTHKELRPSKYDTSTLSMGINWQSHIPHHTFAFF